MNFPLYIAKRYLFSKSGNSTINIITFIATFGVIVGSLALFIVLSGFSGLRTFSDGLLDTSDPDIQVTAKTGKSFLVSQELINHLSKLENVKAFSRVVEERVYLQYQDKSQIASVKGVDESYTQVVPVDSVLHVGTWLDKSFINTAVIGNGLSYKLSLGLLNFGEPLQIMVPKPGKGLLNPANAFRKVNTQISGVYSGTEEFQSKYVFTNIELAQELLRYEENQITSIEINLINTETEEGFKQNLQDFLGDTFVVKTRKELNALYYKVINSENFISYLIFTLIVIIALFNVIGAMIMMIIDKRKNLKTLFSLGTDVKTIKKIFVYQGFLLTTFGMLIGLTVGILLVVLQKQFALFMITDTLAYPVEFRWINVLVVLLTISILGFTAAKIASSRISATFIEK